MKRFLRPALITLVIGIALGVFTSFGQTYLPNPFRQLANSYSIWLLFSFIAGSLVLSPKRAIVAGISVQYLAILFYYAASAVRFDMSFTLSSLLSNNVVWFIGGTLAGPIAALSGAVFKKRSKYLPMAVAFTGAVFFSESAYLAVQLHYYPQSLLFIVAGIIFMAYCYDKSRYMAARTIVMTLIATAIMYGLYAFILVLI